ncbi:hypothetical protein E4U54_007759 [Claviceps lovelessii]|nr:hypothetical protein E4U54_007759 [Claviceps lovelessii]
MSPTTSDRQAAAAAVVPCKYARTTTTHPKNLLLGAAGAAIPSTTPKRSFRPSSLGRQGTSCCCVGSFLFSAVAHRHRAARPQLHCCSSGNNLSKDPVGENDE